ncbi:YdeI family protein [Pedobacter sp. SYSU D00535]|uniref:YdeI/OmpD-associated family protein n=1 Tax=Pedobacter sp. SYSU D00535 TaxID=2810308 RepID=UPI001A9764EA|nr:YdeI family protein [Pedobacter sp. SYSU D00535]
MNPKVDWFFDKPGKWQNEYATLRNLILDCGLNEELKWGVPCYTCQDRNVVLIHGFNDYCAVLFHKGALLKDDEQLLVQQTENVQAARQMRFRNMSELSERAPALRAYIFEAIEVEKAGLKVEMKTTKEYPIPDEFQRVLDEAPEVRVAFEKLTPGRQRGYLLYFSSAKQSKTRQARVEKYLGNILQGKGVDD